MSSESDLIERFAVVFRDLTATITENAAAIRDFQARIEGMSVLEFTNASDWLVRPPGSRRRAVRLARRIRRRKHGRR